MVTLTRKLYVLSRVRPVTSVLAYAVDGRAVHVWPPFALISQLNISNFLLCAVPASSGKSFTVRAARIDGFDGPIRVEINGAPVGFVVSSPLVIEAGHDEALGTIFATPGAPAPATLDLHPGAAS